MKGYLDREDSYYRYNEESVKEELINVKVNRDYAGIGAIIFTFTVLSIVIALSIYTAWQVAYGQAIFEPSDIVNCTIYNSTNLVVLQPFDKCGFPAETLDHYISQGYTIKAVDNGQVFLEKIK